MQKVITWQAPNGAEIDICPACEQRLAGKWPRNNSGEYCTVSHGLHHGYCEICGPDYRPIIIESAGRYAERLENEADTEWEPDERHQKMAAEIRAKIGGAHNDYL